ncbi:CCA tRNA nucleotidyltransferase [Thiospirochaeta perfilievii]|uniref:CCA tRNA nucleotidyltransferase n=1 Tax=Thiospirochaeta perfilievii TaxID=252967 RepID=A0A5C1QH25_9SPIO|nr:CCA tRNA nucleotidyltransferase [Thiospirochaeta perfilievii]QEN05876.1 CCA tRNA nucleotidyltransferase [Thiospirochaeta perfilievii]
MDLFIPEEIKYISNTLDNSGFQCYLVGGAIRNQLLGKKAKDFDLTTNAKPEQVIKLFKRVIPTGIKHGTVTILIGDQSFEITTYRIDGKYTDGRRPDKIQFTPSIEEDLLRRDFTINSIAYNIKNGKILDINRGMEDLSHNIIRAIGIPEKRFDEDALRLVRACRFAAQLEFTIEKLTYIAMATTLSKLKDVSKERISEELIKILKSSKPSIAFTHFFNCGMLEILFPTIFKVSNNSYETFNRALEDIDSIKSNKPYIKFSRLLSITPEKTHLESLKELKLSNNFINSSLHLIKFIHIDINEIKSDFQVRRFISEVGVDNIYDLRTIWLGMKSVDKNSLKTLFTVIQRQIENKFPFKISDLDVTGNDLITSLNLTPGPNIGIILKKLLVLTLEFPSLNTKEKLINCAREFQ